MANSILSIGTNLGNREDNISRAVELIRRDVGEVLRVSNIYKSDAWGFSSKNSFFNVAISVDTDLLPIQLLDATQKIEIEMGRKEKTSTHYCDRVIDIDILFYNKMVVEEERLTIPHPLMCIRDFVMIPLCEIEPNFIHPLHNKTAEELRLENGF